MDRGRALCAPRAAQQPVSLMCNHRAVPIFDARAARAPTHMEERSRLQVQPAAHHVAFVPIRDPVTANVGAVAASSALCDECALRSAPPAGEARTRRLMSCSSCTLTVHAVMLVINLVLVVEGRVWTGSFGAADGYVQRFRMQQQQWPTKPPLPPWQRRLTENPCTPAASAASAAAPSADAASGSGELGSGSAAPAEEEAAAGQDPIVAYWLLGIVIGGSAMIGFCLCWCLGGWKRVFYKLMGC